MKLSRLTVRRFYAAPQLLLGASIYPRTLVSGSNSFALGIKHMLRFLLVVIKGTQVYDSSKGSFVDLSVLDVLQVFGRAGRPGLETSGEGLPTDTTAM